MRKSAIRFKEGLAVLFTGVCALLFFSVIWFFATWATMTVYEFVFHLKVSLQGTAGAMVRKYVLWSVIPTALIVGCLIVLLLIFYEEKKRQRLIRGAVFGSLGMLAFSGAYVFIKMDVAGYVGSRLNASTFIEDHYANPDSVRVTFPEKKRNLIYIYLESVEVTFTDAVHGGAFPENLIPELTELSEEGEDFSGDSGVLNGAYSMPGTDWTMGGIFAQSAGLPLQIPIYQNGMDTQSRFFPGIKTIGEILQEAGYHQVYLLGSDATFGGRRLYYETHGAYDIEDYPYALEAGWIPEDYKVWWGYEDRKLFEMAQKRLTELAGEDEPFNLTMLTVDTHMEDGFLCEDCIRMHPDNPYADVFSCSSRKTAEFIRWVQKQDFYKDTTIVLCGDHPTMDADFCYNVPKEYGRKTYMTILNGAKEPVDAAHERIYTTFDLFPTTVAALGAEIEGDRLGLGTNLYSDVATLPEAIGMEAAREEINKKSEFLSNLSGIDPYNDEMIEIERAAAVNVHPEAKTEASLETAAMRMHLRVSEIENMIERVKSIDVEYYSEEQTQEKQTQRMTEVQDGVYEAELDFAQLNPEWVDVNIYITGGLGNRYQIYGASGSALLKQEDFTAYLEQLGVFITKNRPYDIFIGVKAAETGKLNEEQLTLMQEMGFMKAASPGSNYSYCAISNHGIIEEVAGQEEVVLDGVTPEGVEFCIRSDWRTNSGELFFQGSDRMIASRGIHILVYDREKEYIVDYVCFNLTEGKAYRR